MAEPQPQSDCIYSIDRLLEKRKTSPAIMPNYIHHITTAVPEAAYSQGFIGDVMKAQLPGDVTVERLLGRIYRHSGIEKRHSVIQDYTAGGSGGVFFEPSRGLFKSPSTKQRNDLYAPAARKLFVETARTALSECAGIGARDVTHVITVSCTGFFAPGPDYFVVKEVGLPGSTHRFHLGFMGCYAAFSALKMADAICKSDAAAVVLVICVELCTLHLQPSTELDNIIATSVFADGAGAAVVSARTPHPQSRALRIRHLATALAPDSEGDMAWNIGDNGFEMVLSTYVPRILEANVGSVVGALLDVVGRRVEDIHLWAVHPGGRAILDKIQAALDLDPECLLASRKVLREYGNMSSATILFVMQELLKSDPVDHNEQMYAMAFGPGLTVESGLFERV
jgi:predicted naringenin-chalcone synthase